ncbi:MAG: ferredoxin III, nif-specific [Magnetospirillum sp.]|nr:ferredoxin III, nif-specific [Magnetospirillum sp.]
MATIQFSTRDGTPWAPQYLDAIDAEACIGCGRCFKVCGQGVLKLMGINDDGEMCDPFDDDEEIERKIMTLANPGSCIGCMACAQVCGANAQTHVALDAA